MEAQRREMSLKDQLAEFNKLRKAELQAKFSSQDLTPNELTPAMQEVSNSNTDNICFRGAVFQIRSDLRLFGRFRIGKDLWLQIRILLVLRIRICPFPHYRIEIWIKKFEFDFQMAISLMETG